MNIEKIDKNMNFDSALEEKDIVWFDADYEHFDLYGIYERSQNDYIRLPESVSEKISEGVYWNSKAPAGVRLRLKTNSPYIALRAEFDGNITVTSNMSISGSSGFDIFKENKGRYFYKGSYIPGVDSKHSFESIHYFGGYNGQFTDYVLNFPSYKKVNKVYIGIKDGYSLESPDKYSNEKPVVFYGSSITQGAAASRPGNSYINILSRMLDMDYINLGFSGSAMGQKEIAEYISDIDMCAFVCDYDHNAPDVEHMKATHYAFYEIIRKKNPDLPYIMISRPQVHCISNGITRRKIIMESYLKAVDSGDKNVYFIDGDSLLSGYEYGSATVEGIHPTDIGFYRMAMNIYPVLKKILYD